MKSVFMCRDVDLWKKLYTTYIRPHLEFAAPVWNLYAKSDIDQVERVQRRATKVPHQLKQYDYPTRLGMLGLTTLEARRQRGDCIQQFKISKGHDEVEWSSAPRVIDAMYGHRERLQRDIANNCAPRFNFFTQRIVNVWNKLPDIIVNANTVNEFKNLYDARVL
jgi:hypothetical protein